MTLEEQVVEKLIQKQYRISFAESCTGGMCCATLVNVPKASSVLDMSFVTYADSAKIQLLGVSEDTIIANGVVSENVAREMAVGVAELAKTQIGIGITGIAGPTGETVNKPIGMVCFGYFINGNVKTYTTEFGNIGRNQVRKASVKFVFQTLLELLNL